MSCSADGAISGSVSSGSNIPTTVSCPSRNYLPVPTAAPGMTASTITPLEQMMFRQEQPLPKTRESVQEELIRLGYQPLTPIFYNTNGETVANLIKVINPAGQVHFVELDDSEGIVARERDAPSYVEIPTRTIMGLSESSRNGAIACANNEVHGMVLECSGGICSLTRDDNHPTKFNEQNLVRRDLVVDNRRQDDLTLFYPIVRLSDIRTNPRTALAFVDTVNIRIRQSLFSNCEERLRDFGKELQATYANYNAFVEMKNNMWMQLTANIGQLDRVNSQYLNDMNLISQNRTAYAALQKSLTKNNHLITQVMISCGNVSKAVSKLNMINDSLLKEMTHLDRLYKQLNI